jgi:hypothetical protein
LALRDVLRRDQGSPGVRSAWYLQAGGGSHDEGWGVAADGAGNAYLAGLFSEATSMGGADLVSKGDADIFLSSFTPVGTPRWRPQAFGGTGFDRVWSLAVDASGNQYVTGAVSTAVDFGGGTGQFSGGKDAFLAAYSSGGKFAWAHTLGGPKDDEGYAVAVDQNGAVYVTGSFQDTAVLAGTSHTSAGLEDAFVASFAATGAPRWSKRFGSTGKDAGIGIAVDEMGNVYLAGMFEGTVDFGAGPRSAAGGSDGYLVSLTPDGSFRWAKTFGGLFGDAGRTVAVDPSGRLIVTGDFGGTMNLAQCPGSDPMISPGKLDIFVLSFTPDGACHGLTSLGGTGDDYASAVGLDGKGNIYLTGFISDTVDFGGGPLSSAGMADIFVASLAPDGRHRWSKRFGGAADDVGTAIAATGVDEVYVTGYFCTTVDLGAGIATSSGQSDVFLLKLVP